MKEKVLSNRQIKAAETKNRIYKSAEHLFNKNGFDDVSIDDIVRLAKVAKGSFYVHFKSKDELIAVLINDYVKRIDTDYENYIKTLPTEMPIGDVLLTLVGKIADVIIHTIGYENMKNLYKARLANDVKTQAVTDYNRELYVIFNDIISKGIKQHAFHSDLPVEELARHFVAAYRGLTLEWCIRYPEFNLKEQALCHFKILLTGIISYSWTQYDNKR